MKLLPRSRSPRRAQRGATFVEYALLLGLFAGAATAGIEVINTEAGKKVESVSASVGELPDVQGSIPETTALGGATTTAPPATTAAPTTTSTSTSTTSTTTSTTTTTAAPTTTTAAPTTTTSTTTTAAPATQFGVALSGADFDKKSNDKWEAEVTVTATNNLGQPVSGVSVTVKIFVKKSNGTVLVTKTATGTTDSSGKVTLSKNGQNEDRSYATFTVTTASHGTLTWDGGAPSVSD